MRWTKGVGQIEVDSIENNMTVSSWLGDGVGYETAETACMQRLATHVQLVCNAAGAGHSAERLQIG